MYDKLTEINQHLHILPKSTRLIRKLFNSNNTSTTKKLNAKRLNFHAHNLLERFTTLEVTVTTKKKTFTLWKNAFMYNKINISLKYMTSSLGFEKIKIQCKRKLAPFFVLELCLYELFDFFTFYVHSMLEYFLPIYCTMIHTSVFFYTRIINFLSFFLLLVHYYRFSTLPSISIARVYNNKSWNVSVVNPKKKFSVQNLVNQLPDVNVNG